MRNSFSKIFLSLIVFTLACFFQSAEAAEAISDTLVVSVPVVDSIFLVNNLQLLAGHLNIDIATAHIIAARIWDNPIFFSEINIWNPLSKKAFDVNNGGQMYLQLQQLIKISGEHHRAVQYNKALKESAQYEYFDLLRNLKYELRNDLYHLNSLVETKKVYLVEIEKTKSLEKALSAEYEKSIVPLKDLVRIQSALFQLRNDFNQLQNQISDLQSDLHQLLQLPPQKFILPFIEDISTDNISSLNLDTLYQTAIENRPDLKADESNMIAAGWNLKYQRSLAVPGATAGVDYFNNGAASFNNYYGLQLSMPLPVFNRNQGGIKEAKAIVKQQAFVIQDSRNRTINEVNDAFNKLIQTSTMDMILQKKNNQSFDKLMQNIFELYVRKQISLKELADYLDLYKEQSKQFYDYVSLIEQQREELNYAVGKAILK